MGLKRPQLLVPVRLDLIQPGPYGHDRFPAEPEDPRLRRLEAQIEALRQQLESLGRNRQGE